jgi:hypothetical protein
VLLTAHAAAVLALAARRQWIHRVRPDSIQGSDLHMVRWCVANETRAYGLFSISLGCPDDDAFARAMAAVRADVAAALGDPRSPFRRGLDLKEGRYVWRDDLRADDLFEVTEDDDRFYRVDDGAKRELVFRFHPGRRLLGCLFDHAVWDGIRIVNECIVPAIGCAPFDTDRLLKDTYRPGLSELVMVYTAYKAGARAITHRPLPTLPSPHDQHVVQHVWSTASVKSVKDALGVPFIAALVGRWTDEAFRWLPASRARLRIGIVVAFDNPRFRNNYSMVSVDVRRQDDLHARVRSVARQLQRRRVEVLGLYHLVNTLEVETLFKHHVIDVLFSPAVFDRDRGLSREVDDMSFYNVPCSTPMYVFACSIDDAVTLCTTNNCAEVDMQALTARARRVFRYDARQSLVDVTGSFLA